MCTVNELDRLQELRPTTPLLPFLFHFGVPSFISFLCVSFFRLCLEDLGKDLVGSYRGFGLLFFELGHYALDVVVGDLLSKHTNVLKEHLDSLDGHHAIVVRLV
jgi:hypothetical protein